MKKTIIALALSTTLIVPSLATPTAQAATAPSPISSSVFVMTESDSSQTEEIKEEAKAKAEDVKESIEQVAQGIDAVRPEIKWTKEFNQLFKTLRELQGELLAIATGNLTAFDAQTILSRAELATNIGLTIDTATTKLTNKVQAAHVEIGFAVTRAVIRLTNLTASEAQLQESIKDLQEVVARVSNYPDIADDDIATIYVKRDLTKKIWKTRWDRDTNILGKKTFATYHELNKHITKAVGVELRAKSTVKEVRDAIADLDAAYQAALAGE
ncbi:CAMP factor family pore-forming toxin [Arcanobacterium pinnipediorum]|uniref:cAMP factor family pore-forming toxin n=1 Tax=Arcanobacterium pinnipediorum TaxID=1503041 RepID=A0ABY5AHE9_9ACTO|nr:CAMP factor family pore-forming toxin [Arcanobacterium pinnipediorum]USR79431.1 CAMP factor family pore-forming toxin [Arcanobacterium pinnipediorum]